MTLRKGEQLDWMESGTKHVTTYPANRHCLKCGMTLSVYNPDLYCYPHRPEPSNRYCGYAFHACPGCGAIIRGHVAHCHDCRPPSSGGKGKARAT